MCIYAGMVLCACNEDHSVIKLLEPPATAPPGTRVTFPGYQGEPAQPNHMVKKKILEKLGKCEWLCRQM